MLENEPFKLTRFSVLNFGQHKGLKVSEVLDFDPGYFLWLKDNAEQIEIEQSVLDAAEKEVAFRRSIVQTKKWR